MKNNLIIFGLCLLAGYLVFAFFFFENKPMDEVCTYLQINTKSEEGKSLLKINEIERLIAKRGLNPYGKQLKEINTLSIQNLILENPLIKSAEVFVTSNGGIRVVIEERVPVLRIISSSGDSYYVDKEGSRLPLSDHNTAYVPLATGNIKEEFATQDLYKFALFLLEDEFWNAQIEQILVKSPDNVSFISRVGDHEIILGRLENITVKLDKLKTFYAEALPFTGWNKYKEINLKFDNQVIGTKR